MVETFWNLDAYYYGQITPELPPPPYGSVFVVDPIEPIVLPIEEM